MKPSDYLMNDGERDAIYESCGCVNHTGHICEECHKKTIKNYKKN